MNDFEQATLEQLVSFKAKKDTDIEHLLHCPKLKEQALLLVRKWNEQRIKLGLKPW